MESVITDPTAIVLNDSNGYKTILFPGNKGPKSSTWEQTMQMAFELNDNGFDVAFLPDIDLEHGFQQANHLVLKLENMDSGSFKRAVDYLLRNEIPYGNIILINKYGKTLELSKKEFKTGIYSKRIKGFL